MFGFRLKRHAPPHRPRHPGTNTGDIVRFIEENVGER
jgi:hypothetical protein